MAGRHESAVIIRAKLPGRLERVRRRWVRDAASGLPAHLTLLYPFVEPHRLGPDVRGRIATVASGYAPFAYRLVGPARWPDTIYMAVAPLEPFVALQADLAWAFPDYPIYGEAPGFSYVPHVTIAEGASIDEAAIVADPAWANLPRPARAESVEVIASDGPHWRVVWRVRLTGHERR